MEENKYINKQEKKDIKDKYLIDKNNDMERFFYKEIDEITKLYANNKNRAWIDSTF